MQSKSGIAASKLELRKQMKAKLELQEPQWFESANQNLLENLGNLEALNSAQAIALLSYIPCFLGEPDCVKSFSQTLEQKGVALFCPRYSSTGELHFYKMPSVLEKGHFGILEPIADSKSFINYQDFQKIICIVPGLAFDSKGSRLGRGKGVYDKFLQSFSSQHEMLKLGVAWSFQVIEEVPTEKHDQKMNIIVTEKGILKISS